MASLYSKGEESMHKGLVSVLSLLVVCGAWIPVNALDLTGEWESNISGAINRVYLDHETESEFGFYRAFKLSGGVQVPNGSISFFGDRRTTGIKKCWIVTGTISNPANMVSPCTMTISTDDAFTITMGTTNLDFVRISGGVVAGGCVHEIETPEVVCRNLDRALEVSAVALGDRFECPDLDAEPEEEVEVSIRGPRR